MALAAFECRAEPHRAGHIYPVDNLVRAVLFFVGTRFNIHRCAAVKSRRDLLLHRRIRQQVACNLLDRELVERHVGIQRPDDPVAIGPDRAVAVALIAIAVGIAGRIEPRRRPPLAILRQSEQAINDTFNATPLSRAGAWLLFDAALCVVGWRRRSTPAGAFTLGVCGSAVVYLMTFFVVGVSTDLRYAYWAVLAGITGAVSVAQKRKPAAFMEQQLSMAA